jgi:hypothetical protein
VFASAATLPFHRCFKISSIDGDNTDHYLKVINCPAMGSAERRFLAALRSIYNYAHSGLQLKFFPPNTPTNRI